MLKGIAAALGIAGLVAVMQAGGCGPKKESADPCKPNGCTVQATKTKVGDGAWSVGDELAEGTWQSLEKLSNDNKPDCGWFITPTPTTTSVANADGTVTIVLKRPAAKTFTTSGCGEWRKIGD